MTVAYYGIKAQPESPWGKVPQGPWSKVRKQMHHDFCQSGVLKGHRLLMIACSLGLRQG
jgi:hypothetical protein